jgi:hypothetical protein
MKTIIAALALLVTVGTYAKGDLECRSESIRSVNAKKARGNRYLPTWLLFSEKKMCGSGLDMEGQTIKPWPCLYQYWSITCPSDDAAAYCKKGDVLAFQVLVYQEDGKGSYILNSVFACPNPYPSARRFRLPGGIDEEWRNYECLSRSLDVCEEPPATSQRQAQADAGPISTATADPK